jgi:phytoene synthase
MNVTEAYARCADITRREARNFAFGIRLLPERKRAAMAAIYAYARRVDDVSDEAGAHDQKLAALAAIREQVDELRRGNAAEEDAVLVALLDAGRRYPLPWDAFDELVSGCEADVRGVRYATIDDLVGYCRQVAGSIGRLSLAVFGSDDTARTEPLADALGVALQLTNILRDIVEDRQMGRVYLPAADVASFGCDPGLTGPRLARQWFDRGLQLLPSLDHRSRACTGAMAGIYRALLARIAAHPETVLDGRISVPTAEKLWIAGRSLAGFVPLGSATKATHDVEARA